MRSKRSKRKGKQTALPAEPAKEKSTAKEVSNALPNELWSQILSYLSKKELKLVRLVGDRHLEVLASSLLFVTAYVAARRGVLNIFKSIAKHPTIRHFIKELVYDASWFDPPEGTSQMRNGVYRITSDCTDLETAKLFREQEHIQTQEMSACLKLTLPSLTHVRRVVYADLGRTAGFPGDTPDRDGMPLISRVASGSMTPSCCRDCCLGPYSKHCWSHRGVFRRQYDGFTMLMRALSKSLPPNLDELSLGDGLFCADTITYKLPSPFVGSSYGGIPYWLFSETSMAYVDKVYHPIFERLSKLDLTICYPHGLSCSRTNPNPPSESPHLDALGNLLGLANNLEHLILSGQIDTASIDVGDLFGARSFRKLSKLELRYCEAKYSDLVSIFLSHKGSLQNVKFDFFSINRGTWIQLDRFLSIELPNLSVTTGWVWQDGEAYFPEDPTPDRPWFPRDEYIRHSPDTEEPFADFEGRESDGEEDLEYSTDSEASEDNGPGKA